MKASRLRSWLLIVANTGGTRNTTLRTTGSTASPDWFRLESLNGRGLMQPIALYVHIPFCETKCPYCDFNMYAKIESLIPGYVSALRTEIELWA